MNGECLREIGGASVIGYAVVKPENIHTGNAKQVVAGEEMGPAKAMIIAQYKSDSVHMATLFGRAGYRN
ncbi:MAG: hypothetical protein R3F37_09980 [Candidatus Competibacteraceae bacterium]